MLTEKQLRERLSGIGSSDAAAVLGVNPYRSADDILQEKLGLAPPFEGNEATYWGDVMEPILRKEYQKRTGWKVKTKATASRMRLWPYILCHVDGLIAHKSRGMGVLEIKTMRFPPKDMKEHYHYVQLQHHLLVTGLPWGVIAAHFGGNEFVHDRFVYERDEDMMKAMLKVYEQFWAKVEDARKEMAA